LSITDRLRCWAPSHRQLVSMGIAPDKYSRWLDNVKSRPPPGRAKSLAEHAFDCSSDAGVLISREHYIGTLRSSQTSIQLRSPAASLQHPRTFEQEVHEVSCSVVRPLEVPIASLVNPAVSQGLAKFLQRGFQDFLHRRLADRSQPEFPFAKATARHRSTSQSCRTVSTG